MHTILIRNPYVILTHNDNVKVVRKSILIENGIISKIGDLSELRKENVDLVLNAENMIAIPGFVNVHTHVPMTLFRGIADDYDTNDWLNIIWPLEKHLTKEDIYYCALLGIIEMVKSGITCFSDHYFFEEVVINAALKVGVRIFSCESVIDADNGPVNGDPLSRVERLVKRYSNNDMVKVGISPHSIYSVSLDKLKEVSNFANDYDLDVHIHFAETYKEVEYSLKVYGKRPIEVLKDAGLLNNRLMVAHAIFVNDYDIELMRKYHVKVAYIPTIAMKHGLGIPPVFKMVRENILVGIGTDGPASNNNLDMIEEMRIGLLLQRLATKNPRIMRGRDIFRMATINGAKILRFHNLGEIKEGYKADLVLIKRSIRMIPFHNILSHIIFSITQEDIDTVIVNGRVIVKNRKILTVNEEEVVKKVQQVFQKLLRRVGLESYLEKPPIGS